MTETTVPGDLIIYDAHCIICNASVNIIARNDTTGRIFFTNTETATGKKYAGKLPATVTPEMSVAFVTDNQVYVLSDAVIKIAQRLQYPYRLMAWLRIFPKSWRDWLYLVVANNRFRFFKRRSQCIIPGSEVKKRIL